MASGDRLSAAEAARTLAASSNAGTLATLTATGEPWASFVTYGLLGGEPVLCVSSLAEHGRNLVADPRASISIVVASAISDPQAWARVTLAGMAERPAGDALAAAREAHLHAVPGAAEYIDFADFTLWVLRVRRVRWYGGYGRMDVATGEAYAAARPDPVALHAARAIAHLNGDHAESLYVMARTLGGVPDATAATCTGADRYGLDLAVQTPRGTSYARVAYAAPIESTDDLRSATTELADRARITG
ncbi:HugZ family protein [Mycobacterium sp. 1274761.0]|uniref:HugZ family pyridoxamine 5'-phosphate oxidase n=1 Tax=Mycobacterium sp. 1274761.0 TaxID=1834077 RepID=UPI0007FC7C10|nr:DUF2470 domain-containing protein [Mycobacterium sp. 1274761.0]OBK76720.1 pyridoxamine 5'-phosphate oxidase [Mycobacterium sp. 1274761.0]